MPSSPAKRAKDKRYREANAELVRARKAAAYARDREKITAKRRAEYAANLEECRAQQRASIARRGEDLLAYRRSYYRRNLDTLRGKSNAWKRDNLDKVRVHNARRRARAANAGGDLTLQDIAEITLMQRGLCADCRQPRKLTVDHIIPLARGGQHTRRNIQMLCRSCNASKGARDPIQHARAKGLLL